MLVKKLILPLLCLFVINLSAQKSQLKKRIAIFEFQDKSNSKYQWWDSQSVGQGISDMIITELVQTGEFRITDLDDIQASGQTLSFDVRTVNSTENAIEAGKAVGADVVIYGIVTEFGQKQDSKSVRISGIRVGGNSQSAEVGIDLRMVNTNTGEIIFADHVSGSKSSVSPDVSYRQYAFDSRNSFDDSLIGKATRKAVEEAAKLIEKQAGDIPWSAKVITMDGDKVYINCGSIDGVTPGMSFTVYRLGKALIDPDTGIPLGKLDEKIGQIEVQDNSVGQGKASICKVVSGSTFERGDVVRMK